jgi:DNA-binding NarL/FixJ family response regulator
VTTNLDDDTAILATGSTALAMGLRALLLSIPPIRRVEQVADVDALLSNLETTHPALLVIDSSLSGNQTAEILRATRSLSPETRRVILSNSMTEMRELVYDSQDTVIIKGAEPGRLARAFEYLLGRSHSV